jgi:hypothetical protein
MNEAEERAVARLKESKAKATDERFKAGELAGAAYVLSDGVEFAELERLERWDASLGTKRSSVMDGITFRAVADQMNEDVGDAIEDLLRDANGDDIDSPIWVKGFVSGALAKFEALKPELG